MREQTLGGKAHSQKWLKVSELGIGVAQGAAAVE